MTVDYDDAGSGPTVVLLHAGVCDRRMWDAQTRDLVSAGHRVVRPDLRGFGRTPAAEAPYNEADDVLAVLDEAGVGRACVVGSSYGGAVALELASRYPDRVASLLVLSAALDGHEPSEQFAEVDAQELELLDAGDVDGAVELAVSTWLGPDADAGARDLVRTMQHRAYDLQLAAEEVDGIDHPADLGAVTAPTLAVSGEHDLVDFAQIADEVARQVTGATRLTLTWAGHLPSLERPEETGELLVAFAAGTART